MTDIVGSVIRQDIVGTVGGPGLIIQSDGEPSPGSVGADQLVNGAGDLLAARVKLGAADDAVVDAVVDQRNRAVMPATWPQPLAMDFTRFLAGERVEALKVFGAATPAIDGNARLSITNIYSDSTQRVFLRDVVWREGRLLAQLIRGPFWLYALDQETGHMRVAWSVDGSQLEIGHYSATGGVTSLGTANTLAGSAGDLINVELLAGPMAQGLAMLGRSWKVGNARPASPDVFGNWPAGIVGKEVNAGYIGFGTFNASGTPVPAKYTRVEVTDGAPGVPVQGSASFEGSWFPVFEAGRLCMCTVRGGDSIRLRARGTTDIAIEYAGISGVVGGYVPVVDVFVDGVRTGAAVSFSQAGSPGAQGLNLGLTLDASRYSDVEIMVRGIHEYNDKWLKRVGLAIYRVSPTSAGGVVAPNPDPRPVMLGVGDSTLETILARGGTSTPSNAAGDASWLRQVADACGYKPAHSGFGGTGLVGGMNSGVAGTTGSGGAPVGLLTARYLMKGRQRDSGAANVKKILMCFGVNDFASSVGASAWETAAKAFVAQCLSDYPGLEHFIFVPSFKKGGDGKGYYETQMDSVVSFFGDARVVKANTASLGLTFTDGTHPTLADQALIAARIAGFVRGLAVPSLT